MTKSSYVCFSRNTEYEGTEKKKVAKEKKGMGDSKIKFGSEMARRDLQCMQVLHAAAGLLLVDGTVAFRVPVARRPLRTPLLLLK